MTALVAGAVAGLVAGSSSPAQSKGEIVIGVQCDRTGATQIVGTVLCPGFHDYIALVNSKGGVEGHKIKALEIDHEYKVPPAVESYERHKKDGAVTMAVYGTPQIYALAAKLTEDRIPGTSPGLRQRRRRRRAALPVHLPHRRHLLVAGRGRGRTSPRSSSAAASRARRSPTSSTTTRPAGSRSRCSRTSPTQEGFQLKTFAVPPPGVEMGAQVLDIAQRFRADFVIAHLFGGAPSVSIKELKRVGYPLRKVVVARVGLGRGQHRGRRRLRASPRATTPCSSPAWAPTTRC